MAEFITLAEEMEAYANQEATNKTAVDAAKAAADDKISTLETFRDSIVGTYPDAAAMVNEHINKVPSSFGTLGLVGLAATLGKQSTTSANNKTMATSLAEIYRAEAEGTSLADISAIPEIPGGSTGSDPNDTDADFVFKNRTAMPAVRTENQFAIGSMICVDGYMYVYVDESSADLPATYEIVDGWAKILYVPYTGGGGM